MNEWNNTLNRSINSILGELSELPYINQYKPEYIEDLQDYNDALVGFRRLYYDMYRFLTAYVNMGNMKYILTLYPRHVYWSLNTKHLDYIIMLINNASEIDLVKYLLDLNLPHGDSVYSRYIELLGEAKLNYINLKNENK